MNAEGGRAEAAVHLRLRGRLTVSRARRLHGDLLAALARSESVTLEVTEATEADLSFLQLLCAARRSAAARGRNFHVVAEGLPEAVRRLVCAIGADGGPGDPAAAAPAVDTARSR